MAIDDFESWKTVARIFIAVYTPVTGGGPNYYPGRYVGQTVTGPNGVQYEFAGSDQQIFDLLWSAVNSAGTIVVCADWFVDSTLSPPAYTAQQLKPGNFNPSNTHPLFIRSTTKDWFVGVNGGATGDSEDNSFSGAGLRTAVDADGLGAYYTIFPPEFDAFLNWTGIELEFEVLVVWTGQYFVVIAGTDAHTSIYHPLRVYRSGDEGLSYEYVTDIKPVVEVDTWIKYTAKCGTVERAWATRSATPNGTDGIMYYDLSPIRQEIPFPSDDLIELVAVTRVFDNVRNYTEGSDYTVNIPARTISWAPGGFEPTAGKVYGIEFTYKQYANRVIAAISPLNGVIYALAGPLFVPSGIPPVQVLVSHDHGASWNGVGTIPVTLTAIGNPGPCLGWLDGGVNGPAGGVLIATLYDGIWRSADGGVTWAKVVLPAPSSISSANGTPIAAQSFSLPKILVLSGTDAVVTMNDVQVPDGFNGAWFSGRILKTTDGGLSWTQVYIQSDPPIGQLVPSTNNSPNSLVRLNATELLSISQFGAVYYSPDLGDTWQIVEPYNQGKVDNFPFDNSNQFLQIDGQHALFVTAPDGGVWVNVPVATLCGNVADRRVRRGRTVAVAEIEYLYPWEANAQDFGAGGARELIFEVQARTTKGELGEVSRIHVSNPAPDMSGITPIVIALPGALFIDWSSYKSPDLDLDHFDVRYGFSNNPLAMTSTVRRAKDQNNVFIPNLVQSLTVYIQVVPFDAFGEGEPTPIVSGVPLATISLSA